jgi:hypothetical protein
MEIDVNRFGENEFFKQMMGGPTHGLIQYGGDDAAVENGGPSTVVPGDPQKGQDFFPLSEESHVKAGRVVRSAGETVPGVVEIEDFLKMLCVGWYGHV